MNAYLYLPYWYYTIYLYKLSFAQPLPADASPTALSPGYVVNFEDEKDPKEDPADYPADRGDNDDDESFDDDESSNDDDDDDDVEKDDEDKEKEEYLASADPSMYLQMILSPQAENTEAFKTDESASTPST
nr:hypothetical protein [Tanacetum cinerariifolium]